MLTLDEQSENDRGQSRISIGPDVVITLIKAKFGKARLGIEAPKEVAITREAVAIRSGIDFPPKG